MVLTPAGGTRGLHSRNHHSFFSFPFPPLVVVAAVFCREELPGGVEYRPGNVVVASTDVYCGIVGGATCR
jgi:hypothetical protein